MKPIDRLISKIGLFEQTGNREFIREAKAIAHCIKEIDDFVPITMREAMQQPETD